MLKLTVWMNIPSFYQEDLFRALAADGRVDLDVVYAADLDPARRRLGWERDARGYASRFLTGRGIRDAVRIAREGRDRIHIVNGIWAVPAFAAALVALGNVGARYLIYSEAPDPTASPSLARRLLRATLGRRVTRRAAGLLAISHFASDYYAGLGFDAKRIYPFGYFRRATEAATPRPHDDDGFEVLYVGQLAHRKGIDLLIAAAAPLLRDDPRVRVALVGDGPERESLAARAAAAGLADRFGFEGVCGPDRIAGRIARADVLVLPSRWDGWGLVVNEAFSVGVPVVVSDRCGAADVVAPGINGLVFRSEDVDDLRGRLREMIDLGARRAEMAAAALATGRRLAVEAAAAYLVDCLETAVSGSPEKPEPPWAAVERAVAFS